ncbi:MULTISPECIES: acyl-CoA dehydrogenase [Rhodomicrobium]|uniref:acyl-CoA dehydrogenase n=1 Tax=Rhodomicrobium TaxID=1068 RepID=UPI000B4ADEC2|nr:MULTISPECIES: acyl-CoA dehydrogenase [Rhodomicrobium]
MAALVFLLLCLGAAIALALWRAPLWGWAVLVAVATFLIQAGFVFGPMGGFSLTKLIGWLPAIALGVLSYRPIRQQVVTKPAYRMVKRILPPVSPTEREALEAGTLGFDAELFAGEPDWTKLRAVRPMSLTDEERKFLDGPTEELCRMSNDWQVRAERREVPEEIWNFIKQKGFLGMLISKEHGGLGFSAQAQSLILGKVSSRSPDISVVVMVPNSLGPGELIEKFGTPEQKEHYLPRLAKGIDVPCFALTGPYAGSDAASMRDIGVVTKGMHDGKEVLGLRLNWDKRYITLAPNATLLGLAFHMSDPQNLLGKGEDLGITLALIPADHPGVQIGRRHLPGGNAFPNGPTWGENVFIPLDWIIGGPERAGQGWRMLMSCLAAGRAISLPASGTAATKAMLRATSAYARVRSQFNIPIGKMEGIEEPLARIVEAAYLLESARAVTASMVSGGDKPAVISALMKYKCTEWARQAVNDAMDIQGGKAICDGPSNFAQAAYQSIPISITVEGANILTRSLMVIAQGALRSHPWLYKEVEAVQNPDEDEGFEAFETAFEGHVGFAMANVFGAFFHNVTFGLFAAAPNVRYNGHWYRQASRAARNFALVTDLTVAILGGGLKTKQHITGRLADALADLYFLCCMLKRFEDDGEPQGDRAVLDYAAQNALARFYASLARVIANFPNPVVSVLMRICVFPLGNTASPARDRRSKEIVSLVLEPSATRDRLTREIFVSRDQNEATGALEAAFAKVIESDEANHKLERAVRRGEVHRFLGNDFIGEAVAKNVITPQEGDLLRERERLVAKVIAVDHFDPDEITGKSAIGHNSRPASAFEKPPHVAGGEIHAAE